MSPIPIQWRPRPIPLSPSGAVALGAAATRLARYLSICPQDRLNRLQGVAGTELIAILGAANDLPWVEGIRYLGKDSLAPGLLLPCNRKPTLSIGLLAATVSRQETPLALLDKPGCLIPLAQARPIERSLLLSWLEKH